MLFQLRRTVKRLTADVTDMTFGSVWVVSQEIVIVQELLAAYNVLALRALVRVGIVAVIALMKHESTAGRELLAAIITDEPFARVLPQVFLVRLSRGEQLSAIHALKVLCFWNIAR